MLLKFCQIQARQPVNHIYRLDAAIDHAAEQVEYVAGVVGLITPVVGVVDYATLFVLSDLVPVDYPVDCAFTV